MVTIDSGQLPSAEGVDEGHELSQVVRQWAIIANGKFPTDCSKLLEIIEETDRLEIWKKNVGGFTFESRNEFLEKRVLLDFDLTEQSLTDIVAALKKGEPVKLTKREEVIARSDESKRLVNEEGLTQQQAAEQLGVSRRTVSDDVARNEGIPTKPAAAKRIQYTMTQYTSAESVANKIRDKFGDRFADELKMLL